MRTIHFNPKYPHMQTTESAISHYLIPYLSRRHVIPNLMGPERTQLVPLLCGGLKLITYGHQLLS